MITKDINGQTLGASYDEAIRQDTRTTMAKLLMDGTEIECGIKRIEITKGSCGDEQFSVGNIISSSMTAEVVELNTEVKGEVLALQIGLLTDETTDTWVFIQIGEFVVSEVNKTLYGATITGHGRLVANSGTEMNPTLKGIITDTGKGILFSFGRWVAGAPVMTRLTIAQLAAKAAENLGCAIQFDTGIDTTIEIPKAINGLTTYEVLQVIASVIGGYATDTADGNVKFYQFSNTPTLECESGQMTLLPDVEERDFEITGLKVTVAGSSYDDTGIVPGVEYTAGSPINCEITNEYVTEASFEEMTYLVGYSYRPGDIELSLGDPRIEGNDVLKVTDADGSEYIVPCHKLKHVYDGGFFSQITAVRATDLDNNIGTMTPLQKTLKNFNSSVVAVKSAVEKLKTIAGNTAQYFWVQEEGEDTGAHITEVPRDEFVQDPAAAGGNILIRSIGLAIRDGLRELATFGSDGVVIGQSGQSRQELNYHAMKMIDSGGNEYLHFSDLRNASGRYAASDTFTADGTINEFTLTFDAVQGVTVTVDGVQDTDFSVNEAGGYAYVSLSNTPSDGAIVVINYQTSSTLLKAFTLGTRRGSIGAYSTSIGPANTASGRYSQTFGKDLEATGESTTVIGKNNFTTDGAFVVGNGDDDSSDALTLDWKGNLKIAGSLKQTSDIMPTSYISKQEAETLINSLLPALYEEDSETHAGFYAPEVADQWSLVDGGDVDYTGLIAPLVKYCQELEARVQALEEA